MPVVIMSVETNDQFYSNLPARNIPMGTLLSDENLFHPVPEDWHIIITDIIGSTNAVLGGRHEDVNLVATGSIVTVLNIAYAQGITLPFFFGGDGATFLVPSSLIDTLMQALAVYRTNTLNNFELELRTGTVPVAKVYDKSHKIRIAKFSSSKIFSIPVVLGSGLDYAEKKIKGVDYLFEQSERKDTELDLSGMQCRWDQIPPPENKEEIVTLLIIAQHVEKQGQAFKKVLQKMDELYGTPEVRQPISVAKLKLKTTFTKLGTEMRARLGKIKWLELIKTWLVTFYGHIYFSTLKGQKYLETLVEMSDTLVIDGKINTVISGSASQRRKLQKLLDKMESEGEILYGMHISNASVMSCYVRDLKDDHIHFVDGSEGGYTKAARMLKSKLKP